MNRRNVMFAALLLVVIGTIWVRSVLQPSESQPSDLQPVPGEIDPDQIENRGTDQDVSTAIGEQDSLVLELETAKPVGPTLVGRQVCKECHEENFQLHAEHGHASTFAFVANSKIADKFAGKTFDSGEPFGTYTYQRDALGQLFASLPEKFGERQFPLQIALGSGHHAVTLLTLLPDTENQTTGIEHRVSWYAAHDNLGITVGHADKTPVEEPEFFGASTHGHTLERCVYCHTTTAKIVDQNVVDLVASVNCEKCHGAGSEHVKQARESETPPPYSVGRAEWDTESEIQLCGDCHRLPKAISADEIREYPDPLTRFQPVGLLRSECFVESEGALKCTTCHSPHTTMKAVTNAQYVQICVDCHQENSETHVACPVSPSEGCIECHMPPVALEQGLHFHDHWIRVRDEE